MRRIFRIIANASTVSITAFTAQAQETNQTRLRAVEHSGGISTSCAMRGEHLAWVAKANDLIGLQVRNNQNQKPGKVEDLEVDVESARIVHVILSTAGVLGIGTALHAVPPGAWHHDAANKIVHLDSAKERLNNSPKFEMSQWAECCDPNQVTQVSDQYGLQPYFVSGYRGDAKDTVAARNQEGNWDKDRTADENGVTNSWSRTDAQTPDATGTVVARNRAANEAADGMMWDNASMDYGPHLARFKKATKVMGMSVMIRQDEKAGKVENIMVDLTTGRIVSEVISSGGFIGMRNELSADPPVALRFEADRANLQLGPSKKSLNAAPHFKAGQWPDLGRPMYADAVHRSYNVKPCFTTHALSEQQRT